MQLIHNQKYSAEAILESSKVCGEAELKYLELFNFKTQTQKVDFFYFELDKLTDEDISAFGINQQDLEGFLILNDLELKDLIVVKLCNQSGDWNFKFTAVKDTFFKNLKDNVIDLSFLTILEENFSNIFTAKLRIIE